MGARPYASTACDPFGKKPSDEIGNKALRTLLVRGDPEAAGVVQGAIEDFARELARIIAKFVELKSRRGIERLVIGGGLRETRVGGSRSGGQASLMEIRGYRTRGAPDPP